ncbi:PREDICTED: glycine-rich protein DOT1-like, partial [Rhagoletis zephyria]|uniref:glycine-rich protein DOT1-like n=1 Tax=Rhagoletis zephyria TaxID=28612 RepID=UPI0008116039
PTLTQAIAVPGGMSIVQLLPTNQASNMVQSVIQPNHQSVIQAPNTTSLPLQLSGGGGGNNGKDGGGGNNSDSGSAGSDAAAHQAAIYAADEEAKRRREGLARRPSYRKILNDLTDGGDKTMLPASIQIGGGDGGQGGGGGGISTIMTSGSSGNGGGGGGSTIVQYASAHDGQFIVP